MTYGETKELIQDPNPKTRRAVAGQPDARPEILYYLAEDSDPSVRREVAANPQAPIHADLLLAQDPDDEVRLELARKIGRALPHLNLAQTVRLRELTIEAIETLAKDALPIVRAALAEELKTSRQAPHDLIVRLARDIEAIVAAPILEYSPLLNEQDLLEIIASGVASGHLIAIARRADLSAPVSDAVADTRDAAAVAALLANPSAQIREETLDALAEDAEPVEIWHAPLVTRPELSLRAMRRISQFVGSSLLAILAERHNLPPKFSDQLQKALRERLAEVEKVEREQRPKTKAELVIDILQSGQLNDEMLTSAIDRGDREFVLHALAASCQLDLNIVQKIFESRSTKIITALAWKGGFKPRTAMRLQLRTAGIPPKAILNAKDGLHFPMTEEEMQWQLDYMCK